MSVLGTTIAQSVAGVPGAERSARPIGPPKETERGRKGTALHSRDDDEDIDSVQVSDDARSLKDAVDEETRQERRGHEATPEHGHEIEGDEPQAPTGSAESVPGSAGGPPIVHIDIEA